MGRKIQRMLSLALALFMVLGMVPTSVFATSSWEESNAYLDVQDGEIANTELFSKFVDLFGEGPASGTTFLGDWGGDFQYADKEKFLNGTRVYADTTEDADLSHGVTYYS